MSSEKMHSSHWGVFRVSEGDHDLSVTAWGDDPDPSPLLGNFTDAADHPVRIGKPAVRRGWLEHGPGPDNRRGADEYIEVEWEQALDLAAAELARVNRVFGAEAVFGGSYGWSSAGRFHHAQSQVHRFLNTTIGGYVRSVNSYSSGAAAVILPHIIGELNEVARRGVSWDDIVAHTDIILSFGGMALKNSQVASGGISRHTERESMRLAAERGARFINFSPLRSDMPPEARARWHAIAPGSDAALMLALIHDIVVNGDADKAFLERYCEGWSQFEDYVLGKADGLAKTPQWAAGICRYPAQAIAALARELAEKRVLITVSHSLQRAEHGEQPVWLGLALAAVLGQPGLPGGGYAYALGAIGHYGKHHNIVAFPPFPQGVNQVNTFIPVARVADMLLHPGEHYDFNGQRLTYPHIRLAWWAGGNPFHHHQDLGRLRRAFSQLDTLIVHEPFWTATARHADIVLPATMTLERDDVGGTPTDPLLVAMQKVREPQGEARDDYTIFSALARRLGAEHTFTQGRSSQQWLRHLYRQMQDKLGQHGLSAPDFDTFWQAGSLLLPQTKDGDRLLRHFRADPGGAPLPTPSGKIELFSRTIAGFGYADCPGHPAWLAARQQPDAHHPLWLIANQPATRLHSQLDFGQWSASHKQNEREICQIHPCDASKRAIRNGDIVKIFNQRGALLACARITEDIMSGVVQVPTGAWFAPLEPLADKPFCVHGNPNVVTSDTGTSSLAQGCTGQIAIVEIVKFDGPLPAMNAFKPPHLTKGLNPASE
ncbi:Asp-tRNA(Asn)/Glu-tRNA(Gln) amidotransferase GatCAB subunit C [Superficieibacter electus]|uniref:Asp-tRNA(Asn)/Glu-tRNA(Gln) amidotransferase GatCAB subunit C n=1 Tax=Superficieibacter electus TaxID=2022662 RepID=A0A2P5GUD9_9ENTR|nr:molybdopterin-dependent oxidoreductase [Superficieibacter electus]POP47325.1 Asp-tRNA(Asn)/Glu-tRNA(Gln) amidotransferase GatCAB subunit C [Superficieibacter electus]POP50172.1 Asp-tRNA(Asn)/Glu-tRNA(Gln) amidotransferase GatCAB subunit C [Superficieibacter electus]